MRKSQPIGTMSSEVKGRWTHDKKMTALPDAGGWQGRRRGNGYAAALATAARPFVSRLISSLTS